MSFLNCSGSAVRIRGHVFVTPAPHLSVFGFHLSHHSRTKSMLTVPCPSRSIFPHVLANLTFSGVFRIRPFSSARVSASHAASFAIFLISSWVMAASLAACRDNKLSNLSDKKGQARGRRQQAERRKFPLPLPPCRGGNELPAWVFCNRDGGPAATTYLESLFRSVLKKAGLQRRRFHDIRHTYASLLIQQGESLAYVKDQLGHSNISMTVDTYGHWVPGVNRDAVDRLPKLSVVI